MMRSFLFVPGDSPRKFAKAMGGEADALILDLEDSVAAPAKAAARSCVRDMLQAERGGKALFVRVNALDTGLILADLTAVMPLAPDGIVLPKCEGPNDLRTCAHYLAAFEAAHDLQQTNILAITTETAASLFLLGQYRDVDPRLWGFMWGRKIWPRPLAHGKAQKMASTPNRSGWPVTYASPGPHRQRWLP